MFGGVWRYGLNKNLRNSLIKEVWIVGLKVVFKLLIWFNGAILKHISEAISGDALIYSNLFIALVGKRESKFVFNRNLEYRNSFNKGSSCYEVYVVSIKDSILWFL